LKNTALILSTLALVLGGAFALSNKAEAYRGDPTVQGPEYSEERHEAMTGAFENNDYEAWKNLMQGRGKVKDVINEGNFARFSEAHKLALEGNVDEAHQIREELGLGLGNGSGEKGQFEDRGFGKNQ